MTQYTNAQKILTNREIQSWDTKFVYNSFNLEELQSIFLDNDQKFTDIKTYLTKFNNEIKVHQGQNKRMIFGPTRHTFYQKLVNLTREIISTKDKSEQQIQLNKVHKWASKQIELFDQMIQTKKERPKFIDQSSKTQNQNSSLPSDIIAEQLKDYEENSRTLHLSVDDPITRLKDFKTRQLTQDFGSIQIQVRRTFPKYYKQYQPPKQKSQDEEDFDKYRQNERQEERQEEYVQLKAYVEDKKDIQKQKNYETSCNYSQYVPSQDLIELRMQRRFERWMKLRNREAQENRGDHEILSIMNNYAKNKCRIEKEMNRQADAKQYGNQFQSLDFQICEPNKPVQEEQRERTQSLDQKQVDYKKNLPPMFKQYNTVDLRKSSIEDEISKVKMDKLRWNYRKLLNLSTEKQRSLDASHSKSLSIYEIDSQRKYNKKIRFSEIVRSQSPEEHLEQQIEEIKEVKNRMARHRMNIPINRLMKAIATPNVDSKVNIRLPDPGYDLFKNPFQEKEVGKQKKKVKLKLK